MRDSIREQWLKSNGWEFEYRDRVLLKDVHIDQSAKEQIRLGETIDESHVVRLELAYKNGAEMPAIILTPNGAGFDIADGIHRTSGAKKAGLAEVDAYVVSNADDERQLELLRRTSNAIGSKGFDTVQATLQAVALVDAGWSVAEAARVMNVSDSQVGKRMRARIIVPEIIKAVPSVSPIVVGRLPVDTLASLATITNEKLFGFASELVLKAQLPSPTVKVFAQEAKLVGSDEEADRMTTAWRKQYAVELKRPIKSHGEPAAAARIRSAPKARLDSARARLKGAITYWRISVDPTKLTAGTRRDAADTLKWASNELAELAVATAAGRSISGRAGRVSGTRTRRAGRPASAHSTTRQA